jgi:hypothetical protein
MNGKAQITIREDASALQVSIKNHFRVKNAPCTAAATKIVAPASPQLLGVDHG